MILGAILAGGQSRRFGSDKGSAMLGGRALIDHVAKGLRDHCDAIVILGRKWLGIEALEDRPSPDLGPLGGLNAALHAAQHKGFDAVLLAPCDVLPVWIPPRNAFGPIVIAEHPLCGLWPAALAASLDTYLAASSDRSMRSWIAASGAVVMPAAGPFHNLNTRADFMLYAQSLGVVA